MRVTLYTAVCGSPLHLLCKKTLIMIQDVKIIGQLKKRANRCFRYENIIFFNDTPQSMLDGIHTHYKWIIFLPNNKSAGRYVILFVHNN